MKKPYCRDCRKVIHSFEAPHTNGGCMVRKPLCYFRSDKLSVFSCPSSEVILQACGERVRIKGRWGLGGAGGEVGERRRWESVPSCEAVYYHHLLQCMLLFGAYWFVSPGVTAWLVCVSVCENAGIWPNWSFTYTKHTHFPSLSISTQLEVTECNLPLSVVMIMLLGLSVAGHSCVATSLVATVTISWSSWNTHCHGSTAVQTMSVCGITISWAGGVSVW